jgi:hypothetical protein
MFRFTLHRRTRTLRSVRAVRPFPPRYFWLVHLDIRFARKKRTRKPPGSDDSATRCVGRGYGSATYTRG